MKSGIQVVDAMTINIVSVSQDTTLTECAKIMKDARVGAVIVKKDGDSVGILTEKDMVRKVIAQGVDVNIEKVKDFMESKLITIEPGADIYDALIKMRDNNIRHLPVFGNGGMVGFLTIKDILKIEPQLFDIIVEKYELREESRKPINRVIQTEGICQTCGKYSEKVKDVDGSVLCGKCVKDQIIMA